MERPGEDGLHATAEGPVHQGRRNDRADDGAPLDQPEGAGSGVRMIQFFINRAGKSLPATRRRELEKAKRLLQHGKKPSSGGRTRPKRRQHRRSA
jgi:Protein of unknown function (DUF3175)